MRGGTGAWARTVLACRLDVDLLCFIRFLYFVMLFPITGFSFYPIKLTGVTIDLDVHLYFGKPGKAQPVVFRTSVADERRSSVVSVLCPLLRCAMFPKDLAEEVGQDRRGLHQDRSL